MAGTPFSPTYDGNVPTIGGDDDNWGAELNTAIGQLAADTLTLGTTAANSFKANNTGSSGGTRDISGAEATALLSAFTGDSGSGGAKGLVPAPATGDERKVLTGAGSFQRGVGRWAGCVVTTTGVNGSQPTLSGAVNVASISTVTNSGGVLASATITIDDDAPDANYCVHVTTNGADNTTAYGNKAVGSFDIYWQPDGVTELSVSVF